MKLIFFTHPDFFQSKSLDRYVRMIATCMIERDHEVEIWKPSPLFFRLGFSRASKKWLGYVDQYLLFPLQVRKRLRRISKETLFVFIDQALGPWIDLVKGRPHIIHCHDFLAQGSAAGEFPQNPTGFTGRIYQAYIRKGYRKGQNFISISQKTREDLHRFLGRIPNVSEVVYNGLNQCFESADSTDDARKILGQKLNIDLTEGYLLHVGGNQWYKNRLGVIKIYHALQNQFPVNLPLLMIGAEPDAELLKLKQHTTNGEHIHFVINADDFILRLAYQGASLLLFPSVAEGFGWPIAEAMASGCPVLTTSAPPMSEVGGNAAFYIPQKHGIQGSSYGTWAMEAASTVRKILGLSAAERQKIIRKGFINAERFKTDLAIEKIENIYCKIANASSTNQNPAHHSKYGPGVRWPVPGNSKSE